jgi:hypothetical protein
MAVPTVPRMPSARPLTPRVFPILTIAAAAGLLASCGCGPLSSSAPNCETARDRLSAAPAIARATSTTRQLRSYEREDEGCTELVAAVEAETSGRAPEAIAGYGAFLSREPGHSFASVVEARMAQLMDNEWKPAQEAYDRGDCEAVNTVRDKLVKGVDDALVEKTAPVAHTQIKQCQAMADAAAAETGGDNQKALVSYAVLAPPPPPGQPESPLAAQAKQRATALLDRVGVEAVVGETTCSAPIAPLFPKGSDRAFQLLMACAEQAEKNPKGGAVDRYESILANYPDHPRIGEAKAGLARAMMASAGGGNSSNLPPPQAAGRSSGGQNLTVKNSSNKRLRLVMTGPQTLVEELPACEGCSSSIVGTCSSSATVSTFSVPAGSYQVAVRVMDGNVRPYAGSWSLSSGVRYEHCLYIQTTFR